MKNLISIIVPIYNREKTVSDCLDSLINQSYKNIEIICVNDGSTDDSLKILKNYAKKDKRIKIIDNPKNMGIAYSRNVGIDSCSAEYIMWCDSDDWYNKDMCKKMLSAMLKYNVDFVECGAKIVFDKENLGVRKNWNSKKDWDLRWEGLHDISLIICAHTGGFLWNKLFKKSFIKKHNLSIPPIKTHEDTCFCSLYIMLSKNAFFIKDKLYNYRVHSGSAIDVEYELSKGFTELKEVEVYSKYVGGFLEANQLTRYWPMYNELLYGKIIRFFQNASGICKGIPFVLKKRLDKYFNRINSKEVMHIFFVSNDKYAEHLCVAMTSILLNSDFSDRFSFHIIDDEISLVNKKKILELKSIKNFDIEFISVDSKMFKDFPIEISYMSLSTYYKYLIPELRPDLDVVLYLDCDLIVRDSLYNLYTTDFQDKSIVVVEDAFYPSNFAKKYKIDKYFNAGVMLIDCKKLREENYVKKLFDATKKLKKDLTHEDQDVLNYVFNNDKSFVSQKYNLQTYSCITSKFENKTKEEIISITQVPLICHFNDERKPWLMMCRHPYAMEYFLYKNKSPFKDNVKKDFKRIFD